MKKENNKLELTDKERQLQFQRILGLGLGLLSKALLEMSGMEVNYTINGEGIDYLKKLLPLDVQERIDLAVKEERYEDAAKLKKLLK